MANDMSGKICLVTGGTSGIGKETVISLAKLGATIVFTARTAYFGEESKKEIKEKTGAGVEYLICDLSSLGDIRELVSEFTKKYDRLDVLINNAGVGETELKFSKDNIEMDMAVNYFAPFLLTNLLLPVLKKSAPSRIVNVSSMMHAEGHIDFGNLVEGKNFDKYATYAQSKLAMLLFTRKMAKELEGSGVTANAIHPGVINTKITQKFLADTNPLAKAAFRLTMISEEKAADGIVYLATSPELEGVTGEYFDRKTKKRSSEESYNMEIANRLWKETEALV